MQGRVLIVGASGLVGGEMMAALGPRAIGTYCRTGRPGLIRFDLGADDPGAFLEHWGAEASHILIFGGTVNIDACAEDPTGTAAVNVHGTCALIDAAASRGIVPVYASSDAVYGGNGGPAREDGPIAPITEYGRQKAVVERHLADLDSPWLALRLAKVLAPPPVPSGVLGPWTESLLQGQTIRCVHDQRFTPVGLGDAGAAILGLLNTGATGIFNVAGPVSLTRLQLLETLITALERFRPVAPQIHICATADLGLREARPLDCSLSLDKLRETIDYHPHTPAELCGQAAAAACG